MPVKPNPKLTWSTKDLNNRDRRWFFEPPRTRTVFLGGKMSVDDPGRPPRKNGTLRQKPALVSLKFPALAFEVFGTFGTYPSVSHPGLVAFALEGEPGPDALLRAFPLTWYSPKGVVQSYSHIGLCGSVCFGEVAMASMRDGRDPRDVFWNGPFSKYNKDVVDRWLETGVSPMTNPFVNDVSVRAFVMQKGVQYREHMPGGVHGS